jgi:predicted amino acid racemase
VLELLASAGATQVEPGHGFTGTTYLHAHEDLRERPAMLYLSEVSHAHAGKAYCFGGGLYVGSQKELRALVGRGPEEALSGRTEVRVPPAGTIDFYGELRPPEEKKVRTGDTVVFGFRPQAFFTRANVVPISGVSISRPEPVGVYATDGSRRR